MRLIIALSLLVSLSAWGLTDEQAPMAPELPQRPSAAWLNSPPLQLANFRKQVVMIKFWTYGCSNCVRSIPWVKSLEERYREQGLLVIGVHTPEFRQEHDRDLVARKVRELGVRHPVMLDNDFAYWNAMGNRYWPAFYLIDSHGHVREAYAGEVRVGSRRAKQIEAKLYQLLQEATTAAR